MKYYTRIWEHILKDGSMAGIAKAEVDPGGSYGSSSGGEGKFPAMISLYSIYQG